MSPELRARTFFTTQEPRRFQNVAADWDTRALPRSGWTESDCLAALWAFANASAGSPVREIRAFGLASIGPGHRFSRWTDESLILALFRNWPEARRIAADCLKPRCASVDDLLSAALLALHFSIVHMRPDDSARLVNSEAVLWAKTFPDSASWFFSFADSIVEDSLTADAA